MYFYIELLDTNLSFVLGIFLNNRRYSELFNLITSLNKNNRRLVTNYLLLSATQLFRILAVPFLILFYGRKMRRNEPINISQTELVSIYLLGKHNICLDWQVLSNSAASLLHIFHLRLKRLHLILILISSQTTSQFGDCQRGRNYGSVLIPYPNGHLVNLIPERRNTLEILRVFYLLKTHYNC